MVIRGETEVERGSEAGTKLEWERRLALQLAAQLPDDIEASLRILSICKLLVEFMAFAMPVASRVTPRSQQ